tara:strand:- start:1008 stop:1208 length:201 start_codon:yes stop_codon:yes gene_type:complete
MKILDYLFIALLIALLMLAVSCTKEDDDRCIDYLIEQYQKDDIQCLDGICEVTYITEIYCSYYDNQ